MSDKYRLKIDENSNLYKKAMKDNTFMSKESRLKFLEDIKVKPFEECNYVEGIVKAFENDFDSEARIYEIAKNEQVATWGIVGLTQEDIVCMFNNTEIESMFEGNG